MRTAHHLLDATVRELRTALIRDWRELPESGTVEYRVDQLLAAVAVVSVERGVQECVSQRARETTLRLAELAVERDALTLTLPEPPSANRYWRHAKGRTYLSTEAQAYRLTVRTAYAVVTQTLTVAYPDEPLAVHLTWHRGRRAGDLDNRLKQVLDALQGLAYTDDAQIVELHARRQDSPRSGRLDVTITPMPEAA